MLHAESLDLRRVVTRLLLDEKGAKYAFRYAACGSGDVAVGDAAGAHVEPRGCGHRLCPRCGRRRGGKYAQRVLGWLGHESHGDVWSVVLTQQVRAGESLRDARDRLGVKQRRFMRALTGIGMVGAMTAAHVVWSKGANGWHYHTHVLVELPGGRVTAAELLERWVDAAKGEYVQVSDEQARLVVGAGGPIVELVDDDGNPDFWSESRGPVAKAVQYPLRDLAQGVSGWRLGGDAERVEATAREILRSSVGWKLLRAWGRWRKACPAALAAKAVEEAGEEGDTDGKASGVVTREEGLGTVHRLYWQARAGSVYARDVFRLLEPSVRNASDFAKRFVAFCRSAWDSGVVGPGPAEPVAAGVQESGDG